MKTDSLHRDVGMSTACAVSKYDGVYKSHEPAGPEDVVLHFYLHKPGPNQSQFEPQAGTKERL